MGRLYSAEWNDGMGWWNGIVEWNGILEFNGTPTKCIPVRYTDQVMYVGQVQTSEALTLSILYSFPCQTRLLMQCKAARVFCRSWTRSGQPDYSVYSLLYINLHTQCMLGRGAALSMRLLIGLSV